MTDEPTPTTREPRSAADLALLAARLEADLADAICTLETVPDLLPLLPQEELTPIFGRLMRLRALAEGSSLAALIEADERGVVRESDHANAAAWVGAGAAASGAPVTPSEASAFARVAQGAGEHAFGRLLDHATRGRIGVREAAPALREFRAMRMSLRPEMWDVATDALIDYLATGASARQVAEAHDAIVASYGREGELDERQRVQRSLRSMGDFRRDRTGMYVSSLRLDPESHAALEAVLSAHSRPRPEPDGTPDPRDRPMRRADTLIELVTQVGTTPGVLPEQRPGSAGRAELIVTISAQDLARATGSSTAPPQATVPPQADAHDAREGFRRGRGRPGARDGHGGWGTTESGQVLGPSIVSRLACTARLSLVVLDDAREGGHVLDVGRRFRFATQRQLVALRIRDKGCTFPGCNRPPSWCDAHHIVHWCHGGRTDLDNLALLCERHHNVVHARGYTATVTPDGVEWQVASPRRASAGTTAGATARASAEPTTRASAEPTARAAAEPTARAARATAEPKARGESGSPANTSTRSALPPCEPARHPQLLARSLEEALAWLRASLQNAGPGIPPTIVVPFGSPPGSPVESPVDPAGHG